MKKDQSLILIILIALLCISTISCSQQTIDTDSLTDSTIDSLVNDAQDTNIIDSDLITDTENKTANTNSSSKDDDIIIDIKPWEEYTEMRVCFSYYNGENKPVENFRAIVYKANCHYYSVPGNTLCNKYHILIPLDDFLKALDKKRADVIKHGYNEEKTKLKLKEALSESKSEVIKNYKTKLDKKFVEKE